MDICRTGVDIENRNLTQLQRKFYSNHNYINLKQHFHSGIVITF